MKLLNLLMWVTQFGVSVIFPTLLFLILAVWLQSKFSLGIWVVVVCGILGILTSVQTTRACLHSLKRAAEEASGNREPPIGFNNHD